MIRRFTGVLVLCGGVLIAVATGSVLLAGIFVVIGLGLYASGKSS